jgi:glycolate oxidase
VLRFVDDVHVPVEEEIQAHLLIEVDGNHMDSLMSDCEVISSVVQTFGCGEILFADDEAQKNQLWKLRRKVAEAVKSNSVYKEEDTVVPRYQLPVLLSGVKEIGKRYGFKSVCYWNEDLPHAIGEIFGLCVKLGGTLSGEHGIGLVQRDYMEIAFQGAELKTMKAIKMTLDSHQILNPGKLFPKQMD